MKKFPKKTIILVGIIAVALVAAMMLLPSFINGQAVKEEAQAYLKTVFGNDAIIRNIEVKSGIMPKVILSDIFVKNSEEGISGKLLSIQNITVTMNLMDVLQGKQTPTSITLNSPTMYVDEVVKDRYNINISDYLTRVKRNDSQTTLNLKNGRIRINAYGSDTPTDISDINGTVNAGDIISVQSSFELDGKDFTFNISDEGSSAQKANFRTINASLTHAQEYISYKGNFNISSFDSAEGIVDINIKDIKQWLGLLNISENNDKLYDVVDESHTIKGKFPINYQKTAMVFGSNNAMLDEKPFTLKGQMAFGETDKFKISLHFDEIDFKSVETDFSSDNANTLIKKFLPADTVGVVDITADVVSFGEVKANNAKILATLHDREFVVNQANAKMAGESEIIFFGIIKTDVNDIVNLDGNIEVIGSNIETFISAVNLDEHKLLANHKGAFRAKANMYLSPEQSTISGIRFQAGDFKVQAGLEYKETAKTQFVISARVSGGNFDSMARYINPARGTGVLDSDYDTPKITLPWLNNMKNSYKITTIVDNFQMFGMKGNRSRLVMEIKPGEMALRSVDLNLSDLHFTGTVTFNQGDTLPYIQTDIYLSKFDTKTISRKPLRTYPVPRGNVLSVWSNDPLDISFLKGYNGDFKIKVNEFIHRGFTFNNLDLKANVDEAIWNAEKINADIWGGAIELNGVFNVASIMSAKMEYQLKEVFVHQMLDTTLNIDAVRGKINLSGNLETAGVSPNNLIDNLSANVALYGSEMIIKGFDMAGLIQALPSVRSTSEVANTSRVALVGGKTTFRVVEGAFHVTDGTLKTHGLTMRSKHAIGNLMGSANLLSWGLDMMINFRLPTIAITQYPEVDLYFKDSIDDPLMQIDTRNLESFITKRKMNR